MINHLKWSFISQIGCSIISVIFTILIMNVLSPEDYGLLGMVYPIFLFYGLISNFAIDKSIITRPNITSSEISSLFWLKLGFTTLLVIVFLLSKSFLINFYDESRIGIIIEYFSIVLIIQSVSDIYKAILYRNFFFKKMAFSEISAVLFSGILGLILANLGWSYKSLIFKELAFATLLLVFMGTSAGWYPSLTFSKSSLLRHWKFGKNITIARIMNYFSRNLDDVLAGRKFGSASLGLYTKSYALLTMPLTLISKTFVTAVLPSMPQYISDPGRANDQYKKVVRSVLALNTPLCLILFFSSEQLIGLILPESWDGTVPLIKLFCVLSIFQAIGPLNDLVYEGMDKTDKIVSYTILCHTITLLGILLGFLLGKDIYALALYYVGGNFITFLVNQYFISRLTMISVLNLFKNMLPFFLSGLITFTLFYFSAGYWLKFPPLTSIFLVSIFTWLFYLGCIYFLFKIQFIELKTALIQLLK